VRPHQKIAIRSCNPRTVDMDTEAAGTNVVAASVKLARKYRQLSKDAVVQIFGQRPQTNYDRSFRRSAQTSHKLAAKHEISERMIREIWNRSSWACARPLWCHAEVFEAPVLGLEEMHLKVWSPKKKTVGTWKGSAQVLLSLLILMPARTNFQWSSTISLNPSSESESAC